MKSIVVAVCGVVLLGANVSAAVVEPKAECKNNKCENFQVGMYRIKNTVTMNVLLEKTKGERVVIQLLNEKGRIIHSEVLNKSLEKYARRFNFEEVPDGNYTLEISDDNERVVKNIHLTTNEVTEVKGRSLIASN